MTIDDDLNINEHVAEFVRGNPGDVVSPAGLQLRLVIARVSSNEFEWNFTHREFADGGLGWCGRIVATCDREVRS